MIILLIVALLILIAVYGTADKSIDRTTVRSFDLKRYMGTWYEIARFETRFEQGLDHVQAHYGLRPDGRVAVLNSGEDVRTGERRESRGKARATRTPGRLRVSFFWIFYSDYNVLALGDNYEWSLVGSRSSSYLWILSRTPTLPAATLNHILRLARRRGYDTDRLLFVVQSA